MKLKFWGVRGSIPTPGHATARYGGNTPCIEVRTDRTLLVCDGGSGLREFGVDLMRRCGRAPGNAGCGAVSHHARRATQ